MKKSETIIRTLKLEVVRFRFKQLRKDLFFNGYVPVVRNHQSNKNTGYWQVVYINQHIGREYAFPHISFLNRKSC